MLDHVAGLREAAREGRAVFGTVDTWVIWNLTGGPDGGLHVTDVTNASRTQLMDLRTLEWDEGLLALFDVPRQMLPADPSIVGASCVRYDARERPVGAEVPIAGNLGDQHAALVGQACFAAGEAKNTYGTGNFMLLNTGHTLVPSPSGLLTTMGYAFDGQKPLYALEGSVAVTGSAVQWLRDQLEIIRTAADVEALAASVPDAGGIYFVPAFSGLFAPTGAPMRAGSSPVCRAFTPKPISRARRSNRFVSRHGRCSMRWCKTRACASPC
jgi:glycerol kinase